MTAQDEINAKLTERFISDNPVDIVITRFARVATASGGFAKGSPLTLSAQTMTKINPSLRGQMVELTTEDGHVIIPSFALVALVDADIEKDDQFDIDGETYVVVLVDVSRPDWSKRAYVTRWEA